MKRLLQLLIIIVLLGILGFVITKQTPAKVTNTLTSQQMNRIPKEVNGIPSIWHVYQSDLNGFVIRHPVDVIAEVTTEGDRFYKLGATQSMNTELYDGIRIVITSGRMNGKNVKEFVQNHHDQIQNEQAILSAIKPIMLAGVQGYSYTISSPTKQEIIYIPKGQNEYLQIINSTVVPPNQSRDFQRTVELMLKSIEIPSEKSKTQPIREQ